MTAETERVGTKGGMESSFGFTKVDEEQKQSMVDGVFHSVAENYDKMNDILSLGLHRVWKNSMVAWLSPPALANWKVLDVAGGTGDIAFRILNASRQKAHVTVLDINGSMLSIGKKRAEKNGLAPLIDFVEANAECLPFEDQSFDAYTIAFGIRNVPHIDKALREAFRVLKSGGRFLCLEFSNVEMPWLDKLYDLWSFHAIPKLGQVIANDGDAYRYLVESIRKFPKQDDFASMIKKAGFSRISYRNLTGAIAALHSGWKI
ncbi:bifunctional demethylmenaquinone methyltransferase/2-methoxy-6-polyprenyl-1,4-benzoquinol methylase UbiE [Bartonella sp. 220]|uniref:bifunctional demethylmenaquinone methyltransferase/2-methoxy-6-polyprenyl-1,4-benzoquinol methylase UbiE n=1 Tax=Bartonella sp. 220B TaxID=2967260 RepID=UPI0022A8F3BF|nr:bifunctional demethylmenaquinone methyltransferase/2-methoxy-6-polyprenyl-1,4-benzoquinol methylase UbiE [Bartonella sp. 220B]MCZ2157777.1 bifunctional demethylmenaquinone methyltransferase/2-methoxy-6-polyprenyl-1,4-benzoquinol methylase UbiE [Bartonella sp. 220B]